MDWNERVAARSGLHIELVQIYALLVASTFPKNSGGMQGSEWSRVGEISSLPGKLDDGKMDGSLGNTQLGMLVSYRPLAYPGSRGGKIKHNFHDKTRAVLLD